MDRLSLKFSLGFPILENESFIFLQCLSRVSLQMRLPLLFSEKIVSYPVPTYNTQSFKKCVAVLDSYEPFVKKINFICYSFNVLLVIHPASEGIIFLSLHIPLYNASTITVSTWDAIEIGTPLIVKYW